MLHSNTGATSFKLQPAPKSRKRPQKPRALSAIPTTANSSCTFTQDSNSDKVGEKSGADGESLCSCFEDEDELLTPKASHLTTTLVESKEHGSNTDGLVSSTCSPCRSGVISATVASNASVQCSSSVMRLLASMSPRGFTKEVSSTSPTSSVDVVSPKKLSSSCSPMFPRRSLMRRLVSTCHSATAKSRTSPTYHRSSEAPHKQLGSRGTRSAQLQQETAILLSPGSPLTPRRASNLHTPTRTNLTPNTIATHVAPYNIQDKVEEPLSATLRALGAKRRTQRFASTCIAVQSPSEMTILFDELGQIKSPCSEDELTEAHDDFQVITATRNIFHLPTWVRFEANHHVRNHIVNENRKAIANFSELQKALRNSNSPTRFESGEKETPSKRLPKTSHLGDVAPDSPNGELFSGFEIVSPTDIKEQGEQHEGVVRVVRRPTMAVLRQKDAVDTESKFAGGGKRMLGVIRSAWPPTRPWHRNKASHATKEHQLFPPARPTTASCDEKDRCDGWGGVLTRTSWFPNHTKGPLASPPPLSSAQKSKRFKTLLLLPHTRSTTPIKPSPSLISDDEWEDIDEASHLPNTSEACSFLQLHDRPCFVHRTPTPKSWFRLPINADNCNDSTLLNTNQTRLAAHSNNDQVVSSKVINRGNKSVENRPIRAAKWKTMPLGVRVVIVAVSVFVVAASVGYAVTRSHGQTATHSLEQNGTTNAGLAGLPPRYKSIPGLTPGLPPSVAGSESTEARESSVAKAAHMSQA